MRTQKQTLKIRLFNCWYKHTMRAVMAQSLYRLATGWTVRRSNLGGGEIFCTSLNWPLGPTQPPIKWIQGIFPGG